MVSPNEVTTTSWLQYNSYLYNCFHPCFIPPTNSPLPFSTLTDQETKSHPQNTHSEGENGFLDYEGFDLRSLLVSRVSRMQSSPLQVQCKLLSHHACKPYFHNIIIFHVINSLCGN